MPNLHFNATIDNTSMLQGLQQIQSGVNRTTAQINREGGSLEAMFKRVQQAAALSVAGFSAGQFVKEVATIRGEFQKLEVAFNTMIGDAQRAQSLMAQLTETAATTPFGMTEITTAAKQLLAYGVEAENVNDTLIRLGDISAGLGIQIGDLAYLYGTTMVQGRLYTQDFNQFVGRGIPIIGELAKQFGVAESEIKGLVEEGKVGFPQIEKAIISMTSEGGRFGGLMEAQSKTIAGQISNIEDSIEQMFNKIGKSSEGLISGTLSVVSSLVENWEAVGTAIVAAAGTVGIYKAEVMAIAAYNKASTAIGYDAEIAALQQLLPAKQAAAQSDIEQAVASGRLTEAKAAQITALREEAAAYVANLQAKAAAAAEEAAQAAEAARLMDIEHTQNLIELDDAQEAYDAALQLADGDAIEAAENRLNTAQSVANSSAKQLQAAQDTAATTARTAQTASTEANTAAQAVNTAGTAADTAAKGLWAQVTLLAKRAQDAFNASMFASPLFWIAATIAAVVYAIYDYATAADAATLAQEGYNKAIADLDKTIDDHKQNIQGLIRTIQSADATELDKQLAFEGLQKAAPALTETYDSIEKIAGADLSELNKQVGELMNDEKETGLKQNIKDIEAYIELIEQYQSMMPGSAKKAMSYKLDEGAEALGMDSSTWISAGTYLEAATKLLQNYREELYNIDQAKKAIEKPTKIDVDMAEGDFKAAEDRLNILMDYEQALRADFENPFKVQVDGDEAESETDKVTQELQEKIDDLQTEMDTNPIAFTADKQRALDEYRTLLNNLQTWKTQAQTSGLFNIQLSIQTALGKANEDVKNKNKTFNYLTGQYEDAQPKSFADAYKEAGEAWRKAQTEVNKISANRGNYTETDWTTAQDNLKNAKKAYEDLGGVTSKSNKQGTKDAKQTAEERKRIIEQMNEELASLRQKNIDESIKQLEDGNEKELAEAKNNYDKRVAELKKQAEDWKHQNKEAGMSGLNADGLTNDQQVELNRAQDLAAEERKQAEAEIEMELWKSRIDAMNEYVSQYGTLQERILERERQTQRQIEEIRKSGVSQEEQEIRIRIVQAQETSDTSEMRAQSLAGGIDWSSTFEGIGDVMEGIAKETLDRIDAFMKTDGFSKLSAADKEAYTNLRSQVQQVAGTGDGRFSIKDFDEVARLSREYKAAVETLRLATDSHTFAVNNLKDLQNQLANATDETTKQILEEKIKLAQASVDTTGENQNTAQGNEQEAREKLKTSAEEAADGLSNLQQAFANITSGSVKGFADGVVGVLGQLGAVKKEGGGAAAALEEIGGKAGGLIGAILQLIDILGDTPAEFIKSVLNQVATVVEAILTQLPQIITSVLQGVGGIVGGVLSGVASWFGYESSSDPELKEDLEYLALSNKDLQQAIENLSDIMEDSSVAEASDVYDVQRKNIEEMTANTQESMMRSVMAYSNGFLGIGGHRSSSYKIGQGMRPSDWQAISDVVGRTIDSAEDFFNLTSEEMYNVATQATAVYTKIKDLADDGYKDAAQYMDEYITYWQQLEELEQAYYERLTSISYDSMRDEFKSTLLDMESDIEDFAENFEKMMQEAIIESLLSSTYEQRLKNFYAKFGDAMTDGEMSETEMNALRSEYDQIVADATADIEDLRNQFGWGDSEYDQSGSTGGYESMSQDTGEELNGRFTAVQDSNERIAQSAAIGVEMLTQMMTGYTGNSIILTEMRNLLIYSNAYLEDLVKYAKLTYNEFGTKMDNMVNKLNTL